MTHARNPRDPKNWNPAKRSRLDGPSSMDGESPEEWTLRLTALSVDEPERLVRYLTGAMLACGGWILTRTTTQENHSAELDFEFARSGCIEIYSVLIAAGLALSRDSHLQLTDLCHCTTNLIESRAFIARIILTVYHSKSNPTHNDYALPLAG